MTETTTEHTTGQAETGAGVRSILVVGSGAMGRQIGMAAAVAGYTTTVRAVAAEAVAAAELDMRSWLDGRIAKGRVDQDTADAAWERITFTTGLEPAIATADLVIEAATEKLDVKRAIFAELDRLAPPHAILATNSSTYGSSAVADATGRPEKVCKMHFFNPALVMKAVEVVRQEHTSDDTVEAVAAVARAMGKVPVMLNQEVPGFVANRLMGALRDEALDLYARGVASLEDIDEAARNALGHPMGPFELMDLVGLDVTYLIQQATYEMTGDEEERPHALLEEKYRAGSSAARPVGAGTPTTGRRAADPARRSRPGSATTFPEPLRPRGLTHCCAVGLWRTRQGAAAPDDSLPRSWGSFQTSPAQGLKSPKSPRLIWPLHRASLDCGRKAIDDCGVLGGHESRPAKPVRRPLPLDKVVPGKCEGGGVIHRFGPPPPAAAVTP